MRKSRFTEEQIIRVLKAAQGGEKATDLCRKHGKSSTNTFLGGCRARSKGGGSLSKALFGRPAAGAVSDHGK
jgi:hypothetical protein